MIESMELSDIAIEDDVTEIEKQEEDSLETDVKSKSNSPTPQEEQPPSKPQETRQGVLLLRSWLNKSFRVEMTDGRVLIGIFLCTDRDANIILGSCSEYLPSDCRDKSTNEEPRMLGLVMIPGKHIVKLELNSNGNEQYETETQKPSEADAEETKLQNVLSIVKLE